MRMFVFVTSALASAGLAHGHGATAIPPPRNAIDANEAPWGGAVPDPVPFEPWCPIPSVDASGQDSRNLTGSNGQSCFWFSNGCTIGCDACDGSTRGPIPAFSGDPLKPVPGHIDSGTKEPVTKHSVCPNPPKAAICDPTQRTVNTGSACGSDDDFYYYSPWRRPGSAPVIDACGIAGGRLPGQGKGGYGAQYVNTTHAKVGDLGSNLDPAPSGTVWQAGKDYEVSWVLQANHGGGYSYRLCPANQTLDEACFQQHPLTFTGQQSFRWGGVGGRQVWFNGTYVTEGTSPEGSVWSMNPIPRAWRNPDGTWATGSNHLQTGIGFEPRCVEEPGYTCTGKWGPYNLEIVDRVVIPMDLPAGDYVLGWRWDCEESSQIWQSCSDITITN